MVIVSSSNILEIFATRKYLPLKKQNETFWNTRNEKTQKMTLIGCLTNGQWPCMLNPYCSAAFVVQSPLVVAHCRERWHFWRNVHLCRLQKLLPSCTFFPHHCPQFKSLFNPVRSWWIFFSLLCSIHNSRSYSWAWKFFLAPCIHQCKRAYIQFWCDPVPACDPDMTLFSMGVVVWGGRGLKLN